MFNCVALAVISAIAMFRGIADNDTTLVYLGVVNLNISFILFSITKKLNELKGK